MTEAAELCHENDESLERAAPLRAIAILLLDRLRPASALSIIVVILALFASGCVNSEIAAGRNELSKGDYAAAHAKFLAASQSPKLSRSERRELSDGLCLTEFKLGPPEYPRAEQLQTCFSAAALPGSASTPIVASIEAAEKADTAAVVERNLSVDDIAGAEDAVIRYQTFPEADRNAIAKWSEQIWATISQEETGKAKHDRHMLPAIAAISRRYPKVRTMNDARFKRWVMTNATVSNTHLVDRID